MKVTRTAPFGCTALLLLIATQQAQAAIALDRTRVVFEGGQKSVSLSVNNENKQLPYLAQGWVEDANGKKVTSPLVILPPLQRIEPGAKSQMKIQALPAVAQLPQDRESLFYFVMREVPPRSDKPNSMQIALQTRIKLFYRPQALLQAKGVPAQPWQEQLTLEPEGQFYLVNNPTAYYVTLVDASRDSAAQTVSGFEPLMIAPKSRVSLAAKVADLGSHPVLTYINDYGGRPRLQFDCSGGACRATALKDQ